MTLDESAWLRPGLRLVCEQILEGDELRGMSGLQLGGLVAWSSGLGMTGSGFVVKGWGAVIWTGGMYA